MPIHSTRASQEVVGLFLLEDGPLKSVVHANYWDEVHEPRRKRKQKCSGTELSLPAAIEASVTALSEDAYVATRRMKKGQ